MYCAVTTLPFDNLFINELMSLAFSVAYVYIELVCNFTGLYVCYRSCNRLSHLNLGSCNAVASYDELAVELSKHCKWVMFTAFLMLINSLELLLRNCGPDYCLAF